MTRASTLAPAVVDRLFGKSGAEGWGLTRDEFAELLEVSVSRAFQTRPPSPGELDRYLSNLHVADLALAGACALGRETAWEHFVREHRPVLYRAADALDRSGASREIADSLYADLYGFATDEAPRRSLFRYFHGRSSLATWLRAVLAQRRVDALRAFRRVEPLPDDELLRAESRAERVDPDRAQLVPLVEAALTKAIDRLAVKDRLRLRSYYVAELTLAEIGRITGGHEATVSRHLARTRRSLREEVERCLRDEGGLSDRQIGRAFELIVDDPGAMDLRKLKE